MTETSRTRTATLSGRALVVAGCAVLATYVGLLGFTYSGTYSAEHATNGGTVYLNGGIRDNGRVCLVTPAAGDERSITVPAMPNRGLHISGTRIDPWYTGPATIACGGAVHMTSGTVVRLYPLVEQWIVLLTGLLRVCGGLSRLSQFWHVRRRL